MVTGAPVIVEPVGRRWLVVRLLLHLATRLGAVKVCWVMADAPMPSLVPSGWMAPPAGAAPQCQQQRAAAPVWQANAACVAVVAASAAAPQPHPGAPSLHPRLTTSSAPALVTRTGAHLAQAHSANLAADAWVDADSATLVAVEVEGEEAMNHHVPLTRMHAEPWQGWQRAAEAEMMDWQQKHFEDAGYRGCSCDHGRHEG